MKYPDTRSQYTEMILQQTLLNNLETRDIHRITVKDICEQAKINRGTFYLHYDSIEHLRREIEKQFLCDYEVFFSPENIGSSQKDVLENILAVIAQNRSIALMLAKNGGDQFLQHIHNMVSDFVIKRWEIKYPRYSHTELLQMFEFVFYGSMRIITLWLDQTLNMSVEELSTYLICLENACCHTIGVFSAKKQD